MKNIKSIVIILAALAVIVVAWQTMSKQQTAAPAGENAAQEVLTDEDIVEETALPQDQQTAQPEKEITSYEATEEDAAKSNSMSDIQDLFSGCETDDDCVAVYPSCCKEAYAPYFVNKQYEQELIKEYKRISGEPEQCPELSKCPRSYFGGAKAACVSGRCLQSIFNTPEYQE